MTELTARIEAALHSPRPDEAVTTIKTAVAEELRRLDPALDKLHLLGDFNHSYRPDFMLEWGTGRGKRTRPVYLRLIAGGTAARIDLETLSDRNPLFLGLLHHRLPDDDTSIAEEADAVATAAAGTSLVSNAVALDELDPPESTVPVPTVATSALVRAGSGVLGVDDASRLRDEVGVGYEAAVSGGDQGVVNQAADALRSYLTEADATRIDLQLDLLWIAGGGDIAELEDGERLLHADLRPDEWALLLNQFLTRDDESGEDLWSLFGARMTLDAAAAAVAKIQGAKHVNALVSANAQRWSARYAGYIEHTDADIRGWWVTDETLALGRGTHSIAMTASKRRFNRLGTPMARRSFPALRYAMGGDTLLTLDARADTTAIRLSGENSLPPERVDQVVQWTNEVQGVTVETRVGGEAVELQINYNNGTLQTDREIPVGELQARATRYLDVASAAAAAQEEGAAADGAHEPTQD